MLSISCYPFQYSNFYNCQLSPLLFVEHDHHFFYILFSNIIICYSLFCWFLSTSSILIFPEKGNRKDINDYRYMPMTRTNVHVISFQRIHFCGGNQLLDTNDYTTIRDIKKTGKVAQRQHCNSALSTKSSEAKRITQMNKR